MIRWIQDTHQTISHSGFRRTIAQAPELIRGANKEMFDCCSRKAEGQVRRNLRGRTLVKCGLHVHWSRSLKSSGLTETERKEIIYGGGVGCVCDETALSLLFYCCALKKIYLS